MFYVVELLQYINQNIFKQGSLAALFIMFYFSSEEVVIYLSYIYYICI